MTRWRIEGRPALVWFAVVALLCGAAAAAQQPAAAGRGFSNAGLDRVRDYFRNEVGTGKIEGAVVLIQQHGKPVLEQSFGLRDARTRAPMTADSIFRLYS